MMDNNKCSRLLSEIRLNYLLATSSLNLRLIWRVIVIVVVLWAEVIIIGRHSKDRFTYLLLKKTCCQQ